MRKEQEYSEHAMPYLHSAEEFLFYVTATKFLFQRGSSSSIEHFLPNLTSKETENELNNKK